jgi:endoglycosylceramidase
MRAIALGAALAACGAPGAPIDEAPVHPAAHGRLVDAAGRTVLLRGVNVRAAELFDMFHGRGPLPAFDAEADCRVIGEGFGLDQVRLAINWSLLEPARGQLDSTYVDRLLAVAAACDRHGVATIVDLHQDGFSKYVGDDGAPFWAHNPALPAEDIDERNGGHGSTEAVAQAAFAGFFGDHDGLVAAYARTAAELATRIDRQPGVIGLELINEPFASPDDLAAFYDQVARAVRAAAPGLPVYFEPDATRNVLDFARPPQLAVDRIAYAPHLYTGVFQGTWTIGDTARIEDSVAEMVREAAKNDAPLVVTEFGNDPTSPTGAAWLADAYAVLDQHRASASLWLYEETCGTTSCWGLYDEGPRRLRPAAVTLVARPYPRAIAGALDAFSYQPATRTLTVALHDATAGGVHVLAAPDLVYGDGVTVTCDGAAVAATRLPGRVEVACGGSTLVLAPAP